MAKKNNAVRTISIMMIITLVGKVLGLLREMLYAANFTGIEAEAFGLASSLSRTILDAAFASAISACFIPIFNEYLEKKGEKEAYKLANNFISIILLTTTFLVVTSIVFSGNIVNIIAMDSDIKSKSLTVKLLIIMLPLIILSGFAYSLIGILQSMGEFNIPAAMSIASNGIIIIYYLFFVGRFGVVGLAVVFLLGWLTQILIQIPSLIKYKFSFRFFIDIKDSGIKEIGRLAIPVLLSSWVLPINNMVNTSMASAIPEGVKNIGVAYTLYSVIAGVFVLSIANVIFPKLSKINANDNDKAFAETLGATIYGLFLFLIPMTAGIMAISKPLIKLVFERGVFSSKDTSLAASALFYYATGITGFGLQTVLSRAFYASKNGKIPLITGFVALIINVLVSFLLLGKMGIGGVALASSISMNTIGIIMLFYMYKQNKHIININFIRKSLLIVLSTIFMTLSVIITYKTMFGYLGFGFINEIIVLSISVGAGVLVYAILVWLFKLYKI